MLKPATSIWKPGPGTITVFTFLSAIGMLIAVAISTISSKPSLLRLVLLGGAILLSAGVSWLGWQIHKNEQMAIHWWQNLGNSRHNSMIAVTTVIALIGWTILWTPIESFGGLYYYILGLYPYLIWLMCANCAALVLLLMGQFGLNTQQWKQNFQEQRGVFRAAGMALVVFALLAWAASVRVPNMKADQEDFWYGAGAPVLAFQALSALIIGLGLSNLITKWIGPNQKQIKRVDLLLFVLIWAVAAFLWAREPVRPDFLITQPVAPNLEMYPDYDARNYDIMSQFALLGQGINNHSFFDRVLYPAFLVYLHTLAGQDYARLMAYQAALFAVLPALLFLIGKLMSDRAAGLSLGVMATLRGISHIDVGNIIETAHQKHMLTEYPTAVLLVLAAFLLVKWAQNPSKDWPLAGLAGGVIGLSTLLRPHPLAILALIPGLTILVYRQRVRIWVGLSALVLSCALLGVLPWVQFGGQNISIFSLYLVRIQTIIQQRYPQLLPPQGSQTIPPTQTISSGSAHLANFDPQPATEKSVTAFVTDNFLNNLVTAVQILPTSPYNLEARVVVKKTENFWKPYWDGSLSPWAQVLLFVNLVLIALGLGKAWKQARLAGLIPLFMMIAYFAVNAFGRTSGGRYLVPADWVVVIYYGIGLVSLGELALAGLGQTNPVIKTDHAFPSRQTPLWSGALTVMLISAAAGSLIPLAQNINPLRFQNTSTAQMMDEFYNQAGQPLNIQPGTLQTFLSSQNAIILEGSGLYARQLNKDEGLDISIYNFYHILPYPRTLFTLLGRQGENVIILPQVDAAKIGDGSHMMVVGCKEDGFVQAWAIVDRDNNKIYSRISAKPNPVCPLPEPVCDGNKNCH